MGVEQWLYKVPLLFKSMFRRMDLERELDDELRFHLEQLIEQNRASGMSEADALEVAKRTFGGLDVRKEQCRESWVVAAIDRFSLDTRYALRRLRRDWGFTTGVFLLLALGIGGNVAVFSIVQSILLKPLPYAEPERLVVVQESLPEKDTGPRSVNPLHYLEWRKCGCFDEIALSDYVQELNLAGDGDPERVASLHVTPNGISMLGVAVELGRNFVAEDAEPGKDNVALISDALWRGHFGADPNVVGRSIQLDAAPITVIGVLPPGFRYHRAYGSGDGRVDVYRPWGPVPLPWWHWNNNYSYRAIGRLAAGVSREQALAELNAIQSGIAAEHFDGEDASLTLTGRVTPLRDDVTGQSREGLWLLLAAVGVALLVACLNIANLLLVRATTRIREAAVRSALGASRLALLRGLLIEGGALALTGALAGLAIAAGALKAFTVVAQSGLPRLEEVGFHWPALLVTSALVVACTLVFGLLPALRLTRADPQDALRESSRSASDSNGRVRARQALVSLEVGLSVGLLIVAGLLLTSFVRLGRIDRGFEASNVLTAEVGMPFLRYNTDDKAMAFWRSLLEQLRAEPGIVAAGVTSSLPLRGDNWGSTAIRDGEQLPAAEQPQVQYRFVSDGYFGALGIGLLAGRPLREDDAGRKVAVVSRRLAQLLWADANPVGRRFHRGTPGETFEVVGLVPDVPTTDLAADPTPIVYAPMTATGGVVFRVGSIAVRTRGDPSTAVATLRNAVASLDAGLAISKVRTMSDIEDISLGARRFQLVLVAGFGIASLLIAALGTYSVLSYAVAARTHEFAMRMALGAPRGKVLVLVLRQGMAPVLLGLALGIAAALGMGRLLANLYFSVVPSDATTLATVTAVTLAVALLASLLPAQRAARTSLLDALRYE
jgi:predicted permease